MDNKTLLLAKIITSLLICLGILGGAYFLGKGVENKGRAKGSIVVKGSGNQEFTSDLIVLEGYYPVENDTSLKIAFAKSSIL
mgnify:FL=1